MDLNDIFAEEEARLEAEAKAREASGQAAREAAAQIKRSTEELERLHANGCIQTTPDPEEDDEEEDQED
ncbi:hypothetical protein CPT_Moby_233 [Stenotrophomonas phage Moby]|uniref:Uncharacterized protein n=1 Tax=Stenotrophomonas phage Moby TaxID=2601680 RepID=A0A5P8PMJ0_9CAUD|nr:hypothetical protein HWC58_gp165 [Stenotrophomonas phage Moby]QFR57958.1 hypothetical protein CPT_Moby_233 [Stenotrophomonas phage Moby]